jgi:3-oxoacyl-[acyl-carrier protein] reductase
MPSTAVVTGAASGIGLACARNLLGRGTRIVALDIQAEALTRAFAEHGDKVTTIAVDIGQPEACRSAIAEAAKRLGRIEAFLHFAAAWTGSSWDKSDAAEWDRILRVNLTGTFILAQAVAFHMVEHGGGSIVLTASDSAKIGGVAGGAAYAASKGGVIALTHSLAKALGPKGIRVNAINPGVIDTPMTEAWPSALKEDYVARMPLGRLGRPQDIADVACFLVSDEARFMTGEVVEVNGGAYFA